MYDILSYLANDSLGTSFDNFLSLLESFNLSVLLVS